MISATLSEDVMLSIFNLFAGYPMPVANRGEQEDARAWRVSSD
jgi:hypothetical protein